MSNAGTSEQSAEIAPRPRLLPGLIRRWGWIAAPTLAAGLASAAFVLLTPERYTGAARVLLEGPAQSIDADALQSQAEAVATADVAKEAMDRLGLRGASDPQALGPFLSRLTVRPLPRSRALQIEFVANDPGSAARGANAVAEAYLQSLTEARAKAARATSDFLSARIDEMRLKVADADAKAAAARAQSTTLRTTDDQQVSDVSAQLSAARSAEAAAAARAQLLRRVQREDRLDEAPDFLLDDPMRRLVQRRVGLKAQISDDSRTYLPLHPKMKELATELAALDAEIREAAEKRARVLDADARAAGDRTASVAASLDRLSKLAPASNGDDPHLGALEAEAKSARDQLDALMRRSEEAQREAAAPFSATGRIIAAELPKSPSSPKPWPTILLSTLAVFILSAGATTAATLASLGRAAAAPPAPPAPRLTENEPSPETAKPAAEAVERAEVRMIGAGDAVPELVGRLAPFRSNGKLAVLISAGGVAPSLAVALEAARRLSRRSSTVLVDLGATEDWFADILDREEAEAVEVPGLADLLEGKSSFGEIIRRDLSSGLDVVPSGGTVSAEGLDDALRALSEAYETVVLHASDWRSAPARAASAIADATIVVAPAARVRQIFGEAQAGLAAICPKVIPFAAPNAPAAYEEAA